MNSSNFIPMNQEAIIREVEGMKFWFEGNQNCSFSYSPLKTDDYTIIKCSIKVDKNPNIILPKAWSNCAYFQSASATGDYITIVIIVDYNIRNKELEMSHFSSSYMDKVNSPNYNFTDDIAKE